MQFIKGMDVSMLKELEEHGAEYFLNGKKQDVFQIFGETGVNLIRLRLWNNPYSEEGEAYGGGTNDFATTLELAKRVVDHGLRFMLDFHYSDFWADPAKQIKPKEWENLTSEELEKEVYDYTLETLFAFQKEGIVPEIVQIGNEITNGFLWPNGHIDNVEEMTSLLKAGIKAVRDFQSEIQILLHLDFGTDNQMYRSWFSKIESFQVDFDIIGMSYYPFWNGSLEDLLYNMNDISKTYHKKVLIAETSIGYTTENFGCNGVVFSEDLANKTGYPATKEGQEEFLKNLYNTVRKVENDKGVGVLYWEPAWLPIPECAWANPIGCEYMNDKAEVGNSWGNQALFDQNGHANPALVNMVHW